MILELRNQIPMETPHGPAMAMFVIDQGDERDLQWVTVISAGEHTNEIWTWQNREVRMRANRTMGRPASAESDFIPVRGLVGPSITQAEAERQLRAAKKIS